MLATIGSDQLWTCRSSYYLFGTSESFQSLGTSESFWSLMTPPCGPFPDLDWSFADLGTSESFQSLGTSYNFYDLLPLTEIKSWETAIEEGSFSIEDRIEERSVCDFVVMDTTAQYRFYKGQSVTVTDIISGLTLFGGFIDEVEEVQLSGTSALIHTISAVDNHYLADKRIVALAVADAHAGEIVRDILTDYLSIEGITEGEIQLGDTVSKCILNYVTAADALDELAERAGFTWWIDAYKRLYFCDRATISAPWAITGADALEGSIVVTRGNPNYRNRQIVIGGMAKTILQTEYFGGDGQTRTFALNYIVKEIYSIKVNGITKTVGERGGSGYDWYYADEQDSVNQDASAVVLTSSDVLEVKYYGLYDIITVWEKPSEVYGRAAAEGSSGYVEAIHYDTAIDSEDMADEIATTKLNHYAEIGNKLTFRTLRHGLKAGQLASVSFPEHALSAQMLIMGVEITEEDAQIWYDVEAIEGPVEKSWTDIFAEMLRPGKIEILQGTDSGKGLLVLVGQQSDARYKEHSYLIETTDIALDALDGEVDGIFDILAAIQLVLDEHGGQLELHDGSILTLDDGVAYLDGEVITLDTALDALDGVVDGHIEGIEDYWNDHGNQYYLHDEIDSRSWGTFYKSWLESATPNLFKTYYPSASTYPGGEIPFAFEDRVRYMSLYDGDGDEFFRKAITSGTGLDPDDEDADTECTTICFVNLTEGVGMVTSVGWWGGVTASASLGTGHELDKQSYIREKTNLESWLVRKYDTKGWT